MKKVLSWLLVIVLGTSFASYATTAAETESLTSLTNYVINNGMFYDDSDGDGMADGWKKPNDAAANISGGIQTITYNAADETARYSLKGSAVNKTGEDQYYLGMWIKTEAPNVRFYAAKKGDNGSSYPRVILEGQNGEWQYYSRMIDMSDDASSYINTIVIKDTKAEGSPIHIKQVGLYNLTEEYGVGNEPSKDDVDAILGSVLTDNGLSVKAAEAEAAALVAEAAAEAAAEVAVEALAAAEKAAAEAAELRASADKAAALALGSEEAPVEEPVEEEPVEEAPVEEPVVEIPVEEPVVEEPKVEEPEVEEPAEVTYETLSASNIIINNGSFGSDSNNDGMGDGWSKPSDADVSIFDGIQSLTYNTANKTARYKLNDTATNTTGEDQYYLGMWIQTEAPEVRFYTAKKGDKVNTYPNLSLDNQNGEWQYYSMMIDMSDDPTSYLDSIAIKDAQAEGSTIYVSNVNLFNLTEAYGVGDEPTKAVVDTLMEEKVPEAVVVAEKPVVEEPVAEKPVVKEPEVEKPDVEESVNVEGYLNVKDYGAKGDGVTDDTAAFAAALKDGNIIIPEGLFIVHKLKVPSNREIIGVDREKSRLRINYKVAKDHDAVMDIYSKDNITLKNFTFDMMPPWTFDGDAWKGQKCAYIRGGRNIRVENVDAINNEHGVFYIGAHGDRRGDGLYFINCNFINVDCAINSDRNMKYQGDDNVYIIGCYFEGHYLSEPVFLDDSTNVVVRDCVAKNKRGGSAWRFDTCSDVLVDNCVSDTMGNGAYFDDCHDNIVVKNSTFTNSRWADIQSNNSSVTRINNTFN